MKRAANRIRELHDQVCGKVLLCAENWPYIPHLTILKTETDEQARAALAIARLRWAKFPGERRVLVGQLMFVRENDGAWHDVAQLPLGRGQLSSKS